MKCNNHILCILNCQYRVRNFWQRALLLGKKYRGYYRKAGNPFEFGQSRPSVQAVGKAFNGQIVSVSAFIRAAVTRPARRRVRPPRTRTAGG